SFAPKFCVRESQYCGVEERRLLAIRIVPLKGIVEIYLKIFKEIKKMRNRFMSMLLGLVTLWVFSSIALAQEPLPSPSTQGVRSPAAREAEKAARAKLPTTYDK